MNTHLRILRINQILRVQMVQLVKFWPPHLLAQIAIQTFTDSVKGGIWGLDSHSHKQTFKKQSAAI